MSKGLVITVAIGLSLTAIGQDTFTRTIEGGENLTWWKTLDQAVKYAPSIGFYGQEVKAIENLTGARAISCEFAGATHRTNVSGFYKARKKYTVTFETREKPEEKKNGETTEDKKERTLPTVASVKTEVLIDMLDEMLPVPPSQTTIKILSAAETLSARALRGIAPLDYGITFQKTINKIAEVKVFLDEIQRDPTESMVDKLDTMVEDLRNEIWRDSVLKAYSGITGTPSYTPQDSLWVETLEKPRDEFWDAPRNGETVVARGQRLKAEQLAREERLRAKEPTQQERLRAEQAAQQHRVNTGVATEKPLKETDKNRRSEPPQSAPSRIDSAEYRSWIRHRNAMAEIRLQSGKGNNKHAVCPDCGRVFHGQREVPPLHKNGCPARVRPTYPPSLGPRPSNETGGTVPRSVVPSDPGPLPQNLPRGEGLRIPGFKRFQTDRVWGN